MKKLAIAGAATLLVLSFSAAILWKELQSERGKLAVMQVRMSGLEGAPAVSTAAAPDAPPAASIIGTSIIPESLAQPPEAASPQPELSVAEKAFERGMADAHAQMSAAGLRPQIAQRYPDLAKDLGLSQAGAEKFLDLIARQQAGFADFLGDASLEGKTREEIWRINNARLLKDEREQAAMLGGKYSQWPAYEGTVSAHLMISELQAKLGSGDEALTDAQLNPLAAAMGAEIARITKEAQDRSLAAPPQSDNTGQSNLQYAAEKDRRILNAASSQLTSVQLDHFRQMLAAKAESRTRRAARDEAIKARMAEGARQ